MFYHGTYIDGSTSQITMKFYQQIRSVKTSKLYEFGDDSISIGGVMTSQIIRHDVTFLSKMWHCFETLKTFILGVAIICNSFRELSWSGSLICRNNVIYICSLPRRHRRLPTTYYKRHGLEYSLMLNEKG